MTRSSLCALALTTLLLAGCGSSGGNGVSSKTAPQIMAATTSAAQSASAVHLQAHSANGQLTLDLDMHYTSNGAHGELSLFGLDIELTRIGDTLYLKGNRRFLLQLGNTLGGSKGSAAAARLPSGTWLKGAARSGPLAQLGAFTDMQKELALVLPSGTPLAKGGSTSVAGQGAIELKLQAKLYAGALFVATSGKPYPIELRKTGAEHGRTTFTGWNRPGALTAPAAAVDIGTL